MLDRFLSHYDVSEVHGIEISASKGIVMQAVEQWHPRDSIAWRWLLALRGLGVPDGTLRGWAHSLGFLLLAEDENGIAFGQIGRFWAARERGALVSARSVEEFLQHDDPSCAIAVMDLRAESLASDRTRLVTETRVRALSAQARWRFRLYWLLIRPFSGLLRGTMLRGIKKHAESAAGGAQAG
jgi:hypothetical protein